jgi:hypothetical protein
MGVEHVIMGTILLVTAFCMILGAILTSPKLERMGVRHSARYSFSAVCICTAIYFGWIATLFYQNKLGPPNYSVELWGVRIVLMVACLHFLWSIWRCDK